jgi:DNA-binding NarL/FixJ family response regulator
MEPRERPCRVVVVDDEPALREVITVTLNTVGGFEVIGQVEDAESALEVCEREQPDVVLLDLMLGTQRGVDIVPPLVRQSPRTMIAILTALPAETEEASTLQAGAFVFYEKTMLTSLPRYLQADLAVFRRAIAGEDVVAPSALVRRGRRRPTPPMGLPAEEPGSA